MKPPIGKLFKITKPSHIEQGNIIRTYGTRKTMFLTKKEIEELRSAVLLCIKAYKNYKNIEYYVVLHKGTLYSIDTVNVNLKEIILI